MRFLARHGRGRLPSRRDPLPGRARGHELREPARDARHHQGDPRARSTTSTPNRMILAEANQWPADVRAVFRRRRRMPHGVSLPADAAHLHGAPAGGPAPDHRHHGADAADSRQLPVGLFLRNHDELTLEMVTDEERDYMYFAYSADPRMRHQPRHPPAAGAADGQQPPPHRAAEQPAVLASRARPSSTTATRSAWATTSIWATATACARRCSGTATATPGSRAPIRRGSTAR